MTLNVGACLALLVGLGYDPARVLDDPRPLKAEGGGGTPEPNNEARLFCCGLDGALSPALKGL